MPLHFSIVCSVSLLFTFFWVDYNNDDDDDDHDDSIELDIKWYEIKNIETKLQQKDRKKKFFLLFIFISTRLILMKLSQKEMRK